MRLNKVVLFAAVLTPKCSASRGEAGGGAGSHGGAAVPSIASVAAEMTAVRHFPAAVGGSYMLESNDKSFVPSNNSPLTVLSI